MGIGESSALIVIDHQADAAAARGHRRVHRRRLHRRRGSGHGDVPERRDPAHYCAPRGHFRRRLQRLPAALTLHDQSNGPAPAPERARYDLAPARRDWAAREDLRDRCRQHRPMVERSIAWLIGPESRCRHLRYRGVGKNDQWLQLRMAGLNLRRNDQPGLAGHRRRWLGHPLPGLNQTPWRPPQAKESFDHQRAAPAS